MSGGRSLALALASGAMLSFAFPEASIAPLAWIAIAPLLVVARGSIRRGFAVGFAFGFGFFGMLLVWISVVGWIAWLALVVMEALYVALFGAAWSVAARLDRRLWPLVAPALWVTGETLRISVPVVGFPWGELAQSQAVFPWLLQIAQIGGGKTVSFVLVAVNAMVALAVIERGVTRLRWGAGAIALVAVMAPLTYVIPQIDGSGPDDEGEVLRIAIVQGNASPGVVREDERARVARHLELTRGVADERVDLVVWPESSVGIDPFTDEDIAAMVSEAARVVGAPMIVGANLDSAEDYLVTTLLVDDTGEIVDVYQKTHLVPFGEYVPARRLFGWIPMLEQVPRDAIAGNEPKNFAIEGRSLPGVEPLTHEIGTVVSFEGDFGHLVRERVASGARLVTVATNTSTWERTWASAQHVAMSQVRAAETRVPVVHAALSGISAAVDFDGTVRARTPLYEEDVLVYDTATGTDVSLYVRTGEWLPLLCGLGSIAGVGVGWRRRSSVPA